MAPEVIACDENPEATYDNRVSICVLFSPKVSNFIVYFVGHLFIYNCVCMLRCIRFKFEIS